MNYTKEMINNRIMPKIYEEDKNDSALAETFYHSDVSLTTYKKVVDISSKYIFYGLTTSHFKEVEEKLTKQRTYLSSIFLQDKITNKRIPLKDIVVSANHNSNRYYSEIQNRINTLVKEAESKKLKPIFMTLTLPAEYHKTKMDKRTSLQIKNPKYNYTTPREAVKILTQMFSKIRHDRSLKELSKDERIYYRVNEPHKNGTPHTHILLFVPEYRIQRIVEAFKRLFHSKANDIQTNIKNASAYIMKYINKTLPLSKQEKLYIKEKYLNAWYSKNRITRFNSSRTLAPLRLYRLLHKKYSLGELTKLLKVKRLKIFVSIGKIEKIMEVFDQDTLIYKRNENYSLIGMD